MKVIVFAATKGGTGKTTLTYNVAIEAAKKHQVFIADLDPQRSLKAMWEKRGELTNPRLVSNVQDIAQSIKLLKEAGYDREFTFVDTPGSMMSVIRNALQCADCIVLPVQPSQVDWIAQEAVADLVEDMGLADRTLFVVSRAEAKDEMNERTKEFFATRTKNPILTIRRRPDYKAGFEKGQAGVELSKDAAKEIRDLWSAIQLVMGTAQDRPSTPTRRVYSRDHQKPRLN